jgi:transcriptional regulator with XRE-family HTH domain
MITPLRSVRVRRGLTLQAVADAVGFDTGNLSRMEQGKQPASRDMAERLAAYFNYEVTELQLIYPERYVLTSCH